MNEAQKSKLKNNIKNQYTVIKRLSNQLTRDKKEYIRLIIRDIGFYIGRTFYLKSNPEKIFQIEETHMNDLEFKTITCKNNQTYEKTIWSIPEILNMKADIYFIDITGGPPISYNKDVYVSNWEKYYNLNDLQHIMFILDVLCPILEYENYLEFIFYKNNMQMQRISVRDDTILDDIMCEINTTNLLNLHISRQYDWADINTKYQSTNGDT